MRPYSPGDNVFRTGADERFNSFSDPSAMAFNQANGSWGVNPNLMTPAYTSAYRPNYNGAQGNPYGTPQPGFGQSFAQVFNPFAKGGTNYGGNTYQQRSPYYDTLGYNPLDHAANIAQKWAVPGFTSWLSYKYLAKPLGEMGNRFSAGAITGLAGGSFSAGTVSTMARMGGSLGGFAAAAVLPMAVAEAAVWGADKAMFDPYIAQRQTSNGLRRNFAGVTFGDGSGNLMNGKGFSRAAAAGQAGQLSSFAAKDWTFNQSEVSNLTDLSARAGLLDNAQGTQVADKMKTIMRSAKVMMQVLNTSDFKEVVETMAKLNLAGVSLPNMSSVAHKLGTMASVAGVSTSKMMNTVGAQSEYLFAANGMTPYVGQLMAANAYGAFSVAQRSGLMSPELLARMGGVSGASQSAVAGLVAMSQTPYSGMSAFNSYLGGGASNNFIGNISKFGGAMAKNPLSAIGMFNASRADLASASMEKNGLAGQWDNFTQMASMIPGAVKNGKVDYGSAYNIMTSSTGMGLTHDQAIAMLEQKRMLQNPEHLSNTIAGIASEYESSRQKMLEQAGFSYGRLNPVIRPIVGWGKTVQGEFADAQSDFLQKFGGAVDSGDKWWQSQTMGTTEKPFERGQKEYVKSDLDSYFGKSKSIFKKGLAGEDIEGAIRDAISTLGRNPEIIEAVRKQDSNKLDDILSIAANAGRIRSVFKKPGNRQVLKSLLLKGSIAKIDPDKISDDAKLLGVKTQAEADKVIATLTKVNAAGGFNSPALAAEYRQEMGLAANVSIDELSDLAARQASRMVGNNNSVNSSVDRNNLIDMTGQMLAKVNDRNTIGNLTALANSNINLDASERETALTSMTVSSAGVVNIIVQNQGDIKYSSGTSGPKNNSSIMDNIRSNL